MEKWHKLAVLLDVVHKAAAAGPAYAWIVSMAGDEIAKMAPKPEKAPEPPVYAPKVSEPAPADEAAPGRPFHRIGGDDE